MLGLNSSNNGENYKHYRACYRLLDGRVHDLRVDGDLFETGNYFKKLVYIC